MSQPDTFRHYLTSGGGHVYRLPVQAFPGFWAHVYLLIDGDYRILIDSGSGSDLSNEDLEQGLRAAAADWGHPLSWKDLTHVLITHGHIDHFGGLTWLRQRTDARIGVHELDWPTVSRHEERLALVSRRLREFLIEAGLDAERRQNLLEIYHITKQMYQSQPVDFTYEAQGMRCGPCQLLHLPGHCPGQVAIRFHDLVFTGDHLLERIVPHQSPEQLSSYTGIWHYLDSLQALAAWTQDARLFLGGHYQEIENASERIATIRAHLAQRLRQVWELMSQPRTVGELADAIYGSNLQGYDALLVIEKTGAYVEYLYQRGLAGIVNYDDLDAGRRVPVYYRQLGDIVDEKILPKERDYVFVPSK